MSALLEDFQPIFKALDEDIRYTISMAKSLSQFQGGEWAGGRAGELRAQIKSPLAPFCARAEIGDGKRVTPADVREELVAVRAMFEAQLQTRARWELEQAMFTRALPPLEEVPSALCALHVCLFVVAIVTHAAGPHCLFSRFHFLWFVNRRVRGAAAPTL